MADNDRPLLTTCPICGYNDTATDPVALSEAIRIHMRDVHNMEPSPSLMAGTIKPDNSARPTSYLANEPPAPAPVANLGDSPSSTMAPPNLGKEYHGGAPGDPETQARYPLDSDHR